jgi:RecB family exonuclease
MSVVIEAYEDWLSTNRAWDVPRLLLAAVGALLSPEVEIAFPERLVVFSAKKGESRGEALWETILKRTAEGNGPDIDRLFVSDLLVKGSRAFPGEEASATWEAWHTVDDCCDRLADALLLEADEGRLGENGVLLPDHPAVRRSLKRALSERGLQLKDPRDPTRLRWEESVKTALLPLDVVARRFRYDDVLSFLHSAWMRLDSDPEAEMREKRRIHQEVLDRGIRAGLESYSGPKLERLRAMLDLLQTAFAPRLRVDEVAGFHLAWIKRNESFDAWVHEFFEALWTRFEQDLGVIGEARKAAPLLFWLERLRLRIQDATPPFEKVQYGEGVEIFRLGQTPLRYPSRLWCLAIPPRYTTGEGGGDYYLSDREREILSGHFQVRSQIQEAETRRQVLKLWLEHARETVFLDAIYDWDGRERESIEPLLQEMAIGTEKKQRWSHPRWAPSYLHPSKSPPRQISLPVSDAVEIRASDLEAYSRCPFLGLALGRWKLKDAKESDIDLRGDSRGTLLHEAVRILVQSRRDTGRFSVSPGDALEEAWRNRRPNGLFQGERLATYTKRKLLPVLEAFLAGEEKYIERAGTTVLALEEPKLRYVVDLGVQEDGSRRQVAVVGVPDRIDEHPDGIFVIDYKSNSASPGADRMIEHGYRLQLPLYALAAANHYDKKPIGVQFVQLDRDSTRSKGIFFSTWNGKDHGKLTATTKNNKSLVDLSPDDVWAKMAEEIERHVKEYISGNFEAKPKPAKNGPYVECESCFVRDACGQRRFLDDRDGGEEGGEE